MKLGQIIIVGIIMGIAIVRPQDSYGYFEYRYHCSIVTGTTRIVITVDETKTSKKCLDLLATLNQNINFYREQRTQAQAMIDNNQYVDYRQSYLNTVNSKLLKSTVIRNQILKAMKIFENELFIKTLAYVKYRYKSTVKNLEQYVNMRKISLGNAAQAGASEDLKKIIKKYEIEQRKLTILKLMFQATNFEELMPFYNFYRAGKFE